MTYIKNYGGHLNERSDPDRLQTVTDLVTGQSSVRMLDLMEATSYTEATIAKCLLKLGYLQVADRKPLSSSTWEQVATSMPEDVTFRERYIERRPRRKPAPAPAPAPVAVPSGDGWLVIEPDGTQTLAEVRAALTPLGFEVRLQARPRA